MAWYRKNSANAGVNANKWVKMAQVYRKDSDAAGGQWRKIRRIFRYTGSSWQKVHDSDSLNPVNTVPPTLESNYTGALYYGAYMHGSTLTLTRGTWTGNVTGYALSIQKSVGGDDPLNYSAVSSGTGTSITYTIPLASARAPSDWYRGKVVATNSFGSTDSFVGKFISRINAEVTYFFTTMTGHTFQASWTTNVAPQTSGSDNILSQTIQILSNDTFTHNGTSYSPNSVVYSVSYPITSSQVEQINFQTAGIKQNQSYYAKIIVVANDTSGTTFSQIGSNFTYQGVPVIGAFNITSFTKGTVSASSQGATRSTTINWETATNASKYSVEYQGRNSTSDNWQDAEFFIPFVNAPTTSKTQSFTSNQTPSFYTFIRARIRASNDQGSTMIYNTPVGGSSYIEAVGTAPGQPSFGTITKTDTTASIPVTAGSQGSNYRYEQMEYQYRTSPFGSYPSTWSTQALSSGSGTISLTNLSSNQLYYIRIRNRNQDEIYSPENETTFQTNVALTGATSTSIVSMSRLNDTTVRAYIGSSGASGPYYQLFWTSQSTAPSTASYDAASTTTTVMEDFGFSAGTIYFYVRSSSENLGNTTVVGSGTAGTFSSYGPTTGAASYTFASPSGATSSVNGSSTVGSTLTLTANSPTSAAPSASMTSIVWVVNDGGFGGNSFTGGSVLQNGGTTFVIPQYLYGSVSSVGYSIRAEVTWNNGVGSQIANSTATAVTQPVVIPTNSSAPTLSGNLTIGNTLTFGVGSWNGSPTSYNLRLYRGTANVNTSETLVKNAGNVTSSTYVTTQADYDSGQRHFRAFATATNSAGTSNSGTFTPGQEIGPIAPAPVTQYTISWNGNLGTVSPTSNTVNSGTTVSAPTPTRAGYTFLYWRDSPSAFSYIYQINPGGSWTVTSNIQFYAYWQAAAVAVPGQPTSPGLTGSGVVSWGAPTSGGPVDSYEIQFYTASNSSGSNAAGPYTVTGIGNSPHQLTSPYGGTNANWARVQIRARNSSGPGLYGAWVPSSTTYT